MRSTMKKFRVNESELGTGFQMTFSNNVTISIQFGNISRSDYGQTTAEVAVFRGMEWFVADADAQDLVRVDTGVMSYCTPEAVAWIMYKAKNIE